MTPAQRRTILDIERRSKGWPVGIGTPRRMAERLVALGYAEYAPPIHYKFVNDRISAIRATTKGRVYAANP